MYSLRFIILNRSTSNLTFFCRIDCLFCSMAFLTKRRSQRRIHENKHARQTIITLCCVFLLGCVYIHMVMTWRRPSSFITHYIKNENLINVILHKPSNNPTNMSKSHTWVLVHDISIAHSNTLTCRYVFFCS